MYGSLTGGVGLSVRRKEKNSEILYLLILNSAESLEIHRKIIAAPKILKICV